MTDQEINIDIAPLCGWVRVKTSDGESFVWSDGNGHWSRSVPNYCSDLNAMHTAEMSFPMSNCDFVFALARIVGADMSERSYADISKIAQATARQRAEAFLKAKGLWHD